MRPSKLGILALFLAFASYMAHAQLQATASGGGGGGGGDTITSPNSTITVGGTPTATTLDLNLANPNTWSGTQTFVAPALGTPASGVITNLTGTCTACTANTITGQGTAATVNTGTSGATIPLNNGNNTFSGTDTFSAASTTFSANGTSTLPSIAITGTPATGSTTNPPLILVQPTSGVTAPTYSANGQIMVIQVPSGFTGHCLDVLTSTAGSRVSITCAGTAVFNGTMTASSYITGTNCSSSASPAVCAAAPDGSVTIAAGATTVTVNTTAVTANSQIFLQADDTLSTKLGVTCNSTLATLVGGMAITARTAGTSFQISFNGVITTNPLCISYSIVN